ncbi:acyltransferase family protein [Frateuria soli]|uniref:acyltransferase family protein n=1 Tax=Frateuria soli TaxID=1542730 RepID=UPI001E2EBF0D|nr:acyltransferase [Frateuria soli]UGB38698.1 acyltransferase [Frateuria soli]
MSELAGSSHGGHRNVGIDLLRGLAIVFVLLNHLSLPMRIPLKATALADVLPARLLQALNYNGYEAVFVFFVISGFLIAGNALERWGSLARIEPKAFYARRFARIVPCLAALLAVLAVLHGLGLSDYAIHRPDQSLGGALLAALGLHLNWYEGHTGYLPGSWDVLWSLSIEEAFYLGFPLACLLLRRSWALVPLLLVLALSLPWTRAALDGNEIWQEKAYLPGMAAIATGVLGALWFARGPRMSPHACRLLRWLGALGLAGATLGGRWLWPLLHEGVMLVLTGSTLALLLAFRAEPLRVPRGLRWLCSWGRLSYEIYLSHMFVVFALVRLYRWSGADARSGFLWYLPAFVACWALGMLIARGWSAPCERWLRERWLRPATSPVAASAATG